MTIIPDEDLLSICREIAQQGWTESEWADRESDDMFQVRDYCGGFDATEGEFCFETYVAGEEYWFQFTLTDAQRIAAGEMVQMEARKADS